MRSQYVLGSVLGLVLLLAVPVAETAADEPRIFVLEVRSHERGVSVSITVASLVPGSEDGIALIHGETPYELHVASRVLYAVVASQGPAVDAVLLEKRSNGPKVLAHGSGLGLVVAAGADTPKPMILSHSESAARSDRSPEPAYARGLL